MPTLVSVVSLKSGIADPSKVLVLLNIERKWDIYSLLLTFIDLGTWDVKRRTTWCVVFSHLKSLNHV